MVRSPVLACALLLSSTLAALACGPDSACEVAHGHYLVRPPDGWDGHSPLPVAVYFHGYQMNAEDMMRDQEAVRIFSDLGVLLVAPQGLQSRWRLPVFASPERDDAAFVGEVMADVAKRFPLDRSRMMATGFSLGASMVWYLACQAPTRFTAYVAFSGAFWKPEPADCPMGPVNFLHIHGTSDPTMPLAGRWVGGGTRRQGDVFVSLDTLRRLDRCSAANHVQDKDRQLADETNVTCELDDHCETGKRVEACFHAGAHYVIAQWYRNAWAFVEATKDRNASHASMQ